ncbi:MAG: D-alanyl-D-alanine carboxypeptidase/D-alanyl-D-alanine-endopeptidase [Gemmatimonadota bacterium]
MDALSGLHAVRVCDSWSSLDTFLSRDTVDACIVDADYPTPDEALAHIGRLRRQHPAVAIVAQGQMHGREVETFRLGSSGVDWVLPLMQEADPAATKAAVDRALLSARGDRVRRSLEGRVPPEAARAVAWAVEHARERPSVRSFAEALGSHPRRLARLFRNAGLPTPRRVLLWGRLLLSGAHLGRDGRTVEEAAFLLGYSSASALSRAMKGEVGLSPTEIAERGGMAAVQAALFPRIGHRRLTLPRAAKAIFLGALLTAPSGCATLGLGGPSWRVDRERVDSILAAPPMDQVHFGVLAVDGATGDTLYSRNAARKFVPASNQKILVTATALSLLGPDYRYETAFWVDGFAAADTLHGDLVLVGRGDPTLSPRFRRSGWAALRALADSVAAKGIHHVSGDLVVDASAWDSTTVGHTWEVEDLPWRYAATGGAFAVDEGEIRVVVQGGEGWGDPVQASWEPPVDDGFLTVSLTTAVADSSTRVRPYYRPETHRLELRGRVAQGSVDTLRFSLRDPVRQATAMLARALTEAGVHLHGSARVVWDRGEPLGTCRSGKIPECPDARRLAGLPSPPLTDIVAGILEPSQNWIAEQLIRTLGAERGERGGWDEGIRVVRDFLVDSVGVDSLDLAIRDGSGLSAYNLVTPRAIVRILHFMEGGPNARPFREALAEPGEEDSTLERRLPGLQGALFAKTGTITHVNSLSGYLIHRTGREILFSILSNGSGLPARTVRRTLDSVVHVLAGYRP